MDSGPAQPAARVNPADHALRWPAEVPAALRPEFVRDVLRRARADCGDALPPQLHVDCKGFPCVIVTRPEHREDWTSLRDVCETFAELGEMKTSSFFGGKGDKGVRLSRQSVPEAYRVYEERSAALRGKLSRGEDLARLDCEQEGDADACAAWAAKAAADDLDSALALAQAACEDGSGRGCAVLAQLGVAPRDNYGRACQLGSADGCQGMVHAICGDQGTTCDQAALLAAQALQKALEAQGAYVWQRQQGLGVLGSVLCALGDKEAGLAALTLACQDNRGAPQPWCDPAKKCAAPRLSPPDLW